MNEEKITDAIVPIYCDGDFRGTGFIYKHYLITAEHVLRVYEGAYETINGRCVKVARIVQEYNEIEYKYKGAFHPLNYSDAIYSKKQYGDYRVSFFIDDDLAIYDLSEEINNLSMHEKDDVNEICASLYGCHYYNNNDIRMVVKEMLLTVIDFISYASSIILRTLKNTNDKKQSIQKMSPLGDIMLNNGGL